MAKRRWFHMSAETFEEARAACEELQATQGANIVLRMIWNDDYSSCLVCLDGASKDWRRAHGWIDNCIEVHCRTSYPGLSQIPVSGSWQQPDGNPEVCGSGDENFWEDDSWVVG
ncbi:MAG: hypothetical protein HQ502_05395 [Alphaproteobacteria bacterium]|nr:hypothetical protein [Alphaproteobacteria bacterium]